MDNTFTLHDNDASALVANTAYPGTALTIPANCGRVRVAVCPVTGGTFKLRINSTDILMEKGDALVNGAGYAWDWPVVKGDTVQVKSSTTTAAVLKIQALVGG